MDLGDHLVDVASEFLYIRLVYCRHEDARSFLLCYPSVFKILQSPILLTFRGE